MRIANSRMNRCHTSPLSVRLPMFIMFVLSASVLSGCATTAPSCDGRFEPINLPAPVRTAGQAEKDPEKNSDSAKDASIEPDTNHE